MRRRQQKSPQHRTTHHLVNQVFGELKVLSDLGTIRKRRKWRCVCSCGKTTDVLQQNLLAGTTKSCGCREAPPRRDLLNREFGRWTVIEPFQDHETLGTQWLCRCICGTTKPIRTKKLLSGSSKSCGCLRAEQLALRSKTHGDTGTVEHTTWLSMQARCINPRHHAYKDYGGRGITVCERWLGDQGYMNFLADMGRKPSPQLTLDRINNDGPYSPENCRWATWGVQRSNQRSRMLIRKGPWMCFQCRVWIRDEPLPMDSLAVKNVGKELCRSCKRSVIK